MEDLNKPKCVANAPCLEELEAGTYWWCACGRSAKHPLCDGSHRGSELKPVKIELTERQRVAWCACKETKSPPFCDGSHARLTLSKE